MGLERGGKLADLASIAPDVLRFGKGKGIGKAVSKARAPKGTIAPKKFDYVFGRSTSNAHNAARSNQLALEMKRLGISDTATGRSVLSSHLDDVVKQKGNILMTFSNKYGNFEVRDSLLFGPSGKAVRLESTFQVMSGGHRRFVTMIPKR